MNEDLILSELRDLKLKYEQLRVKFNTHRDNNQVHNEMP